MPLYSHSRQNTGHFDSAHVALVWPLNMVSVPKENTASEDESNKPKQPTHFRSYQVRLVEGFLPVVQLLL